MIDKNHPYLSIEKQCDLLSIHRSGLNADPGLILLNLLNNGDQQVSGDQILILPHQM